MHNQITDQELCYRLIIYCPNSRSDKVCVTVYVICIIVVPIMVVTSPTVFGILIKFYKTLAL